MAKKRQAAPAAPVKPRYLVPRQYDAHQLAVGYLCGCFGCRPSLWCRDCIRERELVQAGTLKLQETQLYEGAEPRTVGLYEGRGSKELCEAHNEIALKRQGLLLPPDAMARLAVKAGIIEGGTEDQPDPADAATFEYPD